MLLDECGLRRSQEPIVARSNRVGGLLDPLKLTSYLTYHRYLDLGPPVPLGELVDEKPPSITVTGDPAGSMPAVTHLFQVFFEGASPCFLRPPPLSFAIFLS